MLLRSVLIASAIGLTGCASIVMPTKQEVKVETKSADGKTINGADCIVKNEHETVAVKSGDSVRIHRSPKDLEIDCVQPGYTDAKGQAVSRVNGAMFGNILLGGLIGFAVDNSTGKAYTYPSWVQLEFGKTLTFDRRDEVPDQPTQGKMPEVKTP